jgi:hypothetical protein
MLVAVGLLVCSLGLGIDPGGLGRALGGVDAAHAASPSASDASSPLAEDVFQPVLGLPALGVDLLGASPGEGSAEAWAYGQGQLLEHAEAGGGWKVVPLPSAPGEKPLGAEPNSARVTGDGGVLLLTSAGPVTRDPGGSPRLAPAPPPVHEGGTEVSPFASLAYAAIDETSGRTGVLVAATGGVTGLEVLHYDGEQWTKTPESVQLTKEQQAQASSFVPKALACGPTTAAPLQTSGQNCWLLAAYGSGRLALFQRVASSTEPSEYTWQPLEDIHESLLGELPQGVDERPQLTAAEAGTQMLTVTAQGVWVDFGATIAGAGAVDVSELLVPASAGAPARAIGRWCSTLGPGCQQTLGTALAGAYRSFAWAPPAGSPADDPGTRIVVRVPEGTMFELTPGSPSSNFAEQENPAGAAESAVFSTPQQGWIVANRGDVETADYQGQSQLEEVTSQPQGDQLQETAVPFRLPLLAVAQAPGSTPGDPGAEAIAVGEQGEVGHYVAGQGWSAEALYDSAGRAQTPTLRGVAWPEPDRAYAVGDNGAMWLWRAETGLWEPDPAKDPNFIGNLNAIAFSPSDPSIGYAVGKGGVLLRYGKTWEQEPLPEALQSVNFTSVAFAGGEALATYRYVTAGPREAGGLAVDDGSGWHVDEGAQALVGQAVLSKVAGLPDGGAVAAGPDVVIERDAPEGAWRLSSQPLPEARNISALAAYREAGGPVRALVSIDLDEDLNPLSYYPGASLGELLNGPYKVDVAPPSGAGQPPLKPQQDPLPNSGYLLRETASGWSDMEHMALPAPHREGNAEFDVPIRPDPVLALIASPDGSSGLAVGGQTYDSIGNGCEQSCDFVTASAMRFPAAPTSVNGATPAPIETTPGDATFAAGGDAACLRSCAGASEDQFGPVSSLSHALQLTEQIASRSPGGVRDFLYTGGSATSSAQESRLFVNDESSGFHSFESTGASGGPVQVIVLDYSSGVLGSTQEQQLSEALESARQAGRPAIVVGDAALGFALPDEGNYWKSPFHNEKPREAADAAAVSAILVKGGASAYIFDYPGVNLQTVVSDGSEQIPAFGTGALGYVSSPVVRKSDSLESNGFLLIEVDTSARNAANDRAPVSAHLELNVSHLALDATDGVLLRRSQVALFEGLARRPAGGDGVYDPQSNGMKVLGAIPYDPIPFDCQGANCAYEVPAGYTFTSSDPEVGDFVAHEPGSVNPRQVELGANRLPISDPSSGLFCAFNPGTTTVSITAGGLTYSQPVTVQAGSVEYPCGTVPLKNPPPAESQLVTRLPTPALGASSPPQVNPQIRSLLVPPPPPPAIVHLRLHHVQTPPPLSFLPLLAPGLAAPAAIVPPPAPPAARPIPPSGTSPVYQSAVAPQEKREEEQAISLVGTHEFSAYRPHEPPGSGPWALLLLAVIAAGAGTGLRRRTRSNERRSPAYARARSSRPPRR